MSEDEDVLMMIKGNWPQFQISKEDFLRPTQELVVRFYNNFVNDANEKIAYLMGSVVSDNANKMDLAPVERVFQEASKLLKKIFNLKLTLVDIYQPIPKRTKNVFKVCIHFIAFMDQHLNELDILGSDTFKAKEEANKLVVEQEELLHAINENAKVVAEMVEFNENTLEQQYKSTKNSHKETMDLKTYKENIHAEKRRKIEQLKWEMQNKEYDLNRLETTKKNLLEQKLTEGEYQNILHTLENLKSESETLDTNDVNMGDGLVYENEVLKHCADCIGELSKCDFNLQNVKKLINQEDDIKKLSNILEKLQINILIPVKDQKLENEKNLLVIKEYFTVLQNEYKEVKEHYASSIEQLSGELENVKQITEEKSQNNLQIISNYNKEIRGLEENMEKLKKAFAYEYCRVRKVEERVVDKFIQTLNKFGEL